jgi:uncharacterized protein
VNTKQEIQDFLAQKTIAIAGLSRDEKAMSFTVSRELKARGYRLLAVNPNAERIGGEKCYPSLAALPEKVGGVLVFTPPAQTEGVVAEAAALGIRHVWMQQGAQSEAAMAVCFQEGLRAVAGKCIMMFAEPVSSVHGVHRWFSKVLGALPK